MVPNYLHLNRAFFDSNAHNYNLTTKEGCGKYTEHFLETLRDTTGDKRFKHLRKYGSQTQYNGHAIDVLAFDNRGQGDGTPIMETDILGDGESVNARPTWQVRETPYSADILMEPEEIGEPDETAMVPWVGYDENGFQNLKKQLDYDYSRRPQGADFDVTVWAARVFHSSTMGPNKKPLGLEKAIVKHREEWCGALGIPQDNHRCNNDCQIGNHRL